MQTHLKHNAHMHAFNAMRPPALLAPHPLWQQLLVGMPDTAAVVAIAVMVSLCHSFQVCR